MITWRGNYDGGDPRITSLRWRTTVRASADGKRLEFATSVDWNTRSRRLQVMFPTQHSSDTARYEVPFGNIETQL